MTENTPYIQSDRAIEGNRDRKTKTDKERLLKRNRDTVIEFDVRRK